MKNQRGFAILELLILLLLLAVLGFVGYRVYKANQTRPAHEVSVSGPKTTRYDFKQMHISMSILPGWSVDLKTHDEQAYSFPKETMYSWTVSKPGVQSKISVSTNQFFGGFEICGARPATINDVSPTKDSDLIFIDYTYTDFENVTHHYVEIGRADTASFTTKNAEQVDSSDLIKNKDLTVGKSFFCIGYPHPDAFLKLSSIGNNDSISATGDDATADIKKMLTSITKD